MLGSSDFKTRLEEDSLPCLVAGCVAGTNAYDMKETCRTGGKMFIDNTSSTAVATQS